MSDPYEERPAIHTPEIWAEIVQRNIEYDRERVEVLMPALLTTDGVNNSGIVLVWDNAQALYRHILYLRARLADLEGRQGATPGPRAGMERAE